MLNKFTLPVLCCFLVMQTVSIADEEPKTADQVIARYIKAIGGQDKVDSVKTMRISATITTGSNETPMVIEAIRPDRMRMETDYQGRIGIVVIDGDVGWFTRPGDPNATPHKMPEGRVKEFQDQADPLGPLVGYKAKGYPIEFLGKEEIEGTQTYKLKVTMRSGAVDYFHLDEKSFLPIKVLSGTDSSGSKMLIESSLGDYKEVDGLLLHHTIQNTRSGREGGATITYEKVEINVDLEPERFKMPEVKKPETADQQEGKKEEAPATEKKVLTPKDRPKPAPEKKEDPVEDEPGDGE
jgi:outer membrane lipoprotein-sorting protein